MIPVIVRSLGQDMYRVGMMPDRTFRPGLELISYLDGNLSSNGIDDPGLDIVLFDLPWWTEAKRPTGKTPCLTSASLKVALDHYHAQLQAALIPVGVPHTIANFANELNKSAYTWHSSVNDDLPNSPEDCTRCRLYRAVGVGVMDQLRDLYNMVHACEMANEAEKDIAIRRASGFNELYDAAMKKETDSAAGVPQNQPSGSRSFLNAKVKRRFELEVEELKNWTKQAVLQGGMASSKWTWGVDLTVEDLRGLIRGADRYYQLPHSGYDESHVTGSLQSNISELLDLEDPTVSELRFDDLSRSITTIPELHPYDIPAYSEVQLRPEYDVSDPEPDLVIEAFTKRAKAEAVMASKVLMQEEVDQPVSFCDYGSEFVPRTALIPHRPWLMPQLPIILPPTNFAIRLVDMVVNDAVNTPHSDTIDIPESDVNSDIYMPDSDDIPDYIDIPRSDDISNTHPSSQRDLPVLDDDEDNAMDVVQSDEADIPMSVGSTDSGLDIVFPESPFVSGVMGRDPHTGRFTAASFAIFTDELLD
jgi:hypothetical protein